MNLAEIEVIFEPSVSAPHGRIAVLIRRAASRSLAVRSAPTGSVAADEEWTSLFAEDEVNWLARKVEA
jgi:hypothetical protein